MNKVLTHRQFNSFAENPSSAIQAWRVRRAMINNEIYTKNNKDTFTRFDIAYATMQQVSRDLTDLGGRKSDIYAANDPTATGRPELGKILSDTAESVIHDMNSAKSGENFVFAGDDELNAPFTWNQDKTILYYRGVNVNAGMVKSPADVPDWAPPKMAQDPAYPNDPTKQINVGADNNDNGALAEAFKKNLPDTAEEMNEALWIDYYKGKDGVEMPGYTAGDSGTFPSWVPTVETKIPDPNNPGQDITVNVPVKRLEDTADATPTKAEKEEAYANAFKESLKKRNLLMPLKRRGLPTTQGRPTTNPLIIQLRPGKMFLMRMATRWMLIATVSPSSRLRKILIRIRILASITKPGPSI